ncbi:hypothetical protein [Scytonema sp. NUACC26]
MVILHSWDDYRRTWQPFMQEFAYWAIQPEGEIQVTDIFLSYFSATIVN